MLWAVELRREESRCQLQDLIRPAQLPILRTKLPHFRRFHTRRPRPSARVHLRLSHPVVDGLRRPDPKFRRHRLNGRPLRSMLRPNLRHHPNSTVPQLLRVAPRSSRHDPILPKRRSLRQTRVGSDNALAESVNGLYKTELVYWEGPWKGADDLELATLGWVDWFNHVRIHSALKYCTPAEVEAQFYARQITPV